MFDFSNWTEMVLLWILLDDALKHVCAPKLLCPTKQNVNTQQNNRNWNIVSLYQCDFWPEFVEYSNMSHFLGFTDSSQGFIFLGNKASLLPIFYISIIFPVPVRICNPLWISISSQPCSFMLAYQQAYPHDRFPLFFLCSLSWIFILKII